MTKKICKQLFFVGFRTIARNSEFWSLLAQTSQQNEADSMLNPTAQTNKMFIDSTLTQTGIINSTFGLSAHNLLQSSQISPVINVNSTRMDPLLYNLAIQSHSQCNTDQFNLLTSLFQEQSFSG